MVILRCCMPPAYLTAEWRDTVRNCLAVTDLERKSDMEQISITRFTPEKIGYRDRGIMKWLGMMLSDHSEALKKEEIDDQLIEVKAKEKMDEEEIAGVLYQAFVTDSPVCIQANVIRNGNYYKDLECKISGYVDNRIYLFLKRWAGDQLYTGGNKKCGDDEHA